MTDLWLPQLFVQPGEHTSEEDSGINSYFDQNGFGSKVLIVNLGSSFVFLTIYLGLVSIHFILKPIGIAFSK